MLRQLLGEGWARHKERTANISFLGLQVENIMIAGGGGPYIYYNDNHQVIIIIKMPSLVNIAIFGECSNLPGLIALARIVD